VVLLINDFKNICNVAFINIINNVIMSNVTLIKCYSVIVSKVVMNNVIISIIVVS
jgi:hypothetical protein